MRANRVSYAEEFDSELDSDPDDAKKKSKANMAVALMDSTTEMDDEVEKVLGHRSGHFTFLCPLGGKLARGGRRRGAWAGPHLCTLHTSCFSDR